MGVKWPVDDGLEFIKCEWFKLLPNDAADEWVMPIIDDDPLSDVTIDCCWCWLSSWSRGGDIGSALILTGAGDEEEGGGVLFDTAKWGIPLKGEKISVRQRFHLTLRTTWYVVEGPSFDARNSTTWSCLSRMMTLRNLVLRTYSPDNCLIRVLEFEGRRRGC